MRTLKGICLLLIGLFFYLFWPSIVFGQTVINEVHAAPSSGNDWIELYNPTIQTANMAGWTLEDSSSSLTTTPVLSNQILPPHTFLVVEVSNRLNNTGDQVKLLNPSGLILDFFTYDQTFTDQSWSREIDGYGNMLRALPTRGFSNAAASPLPTPAASPTPIPSPFPSPSPTTLPQPQPSPTPQLSASELSAHLIMSEVMACPNTGESEWIELQNVDKVAHSLTNWQIKDSQSNTRTFSTQIAAEAFVVIQIAPAMLNNTGGDQILLFREDNTLASSLTYTTCVKGKSLVSNGVDWITVDPTPGFSNGDITALSDETKNMLTHDSQTTSSAPGAVRSESTENNSIITSNSNQSDLPQKKVITLFTPDFNQSSFSAIATPSTVTTNQQQFKQSSDSNTTTTTIISPLIMTFSSMLLLLSSAWFFHAWYTKKSEIKPFIFE